MEIWETYILIRRNSTCKGPEVDVYLENSKNSKEGRMAGVRSKGQGKKVKVKSLSRVRLFATLWTVAHQAPPSMGFSRQEYWSGLPFPSPENLPNPGIKPRYPTLQADTLTSEPRGKPKRR